MHRSLHRVALALSASCLSACGGGGSGSPASFPLRQAFQNYLSSSSQTAFSITGNAASGGSTFPVTGSLIITKSPVSTTTFEGANAYADTVSVSGSLTIDSQTSSLQDSDLNYYDANFNRLGVTAAGMYCVASSASALPVSATPGQTGTIANYQCYTDGTKTTSIGTIAETYATMAATDGNLKFQVTVNAYDTSNVLTISKTSSFEVTKGGGFIPVQYGLHSTISSGAVIDIQAQ